ncbi:MAG: NAD(P)/FAD-dependent oxidoreductase [Gammaproteobacteria bacterium]
MSPQSTSEPSDVVVIGGGPGGSTIATLLAKKGWRVTLLEKDRHPRFHIGESLLPMNLPLLERLGVLDQVREIGVQKNGAEFASYQDADKCETIYFADALDKSHPYAFQVERAGFDKLLFDNAGAQGVTAREGVRVIDVALREDATKRATVVNENGARETLETRFIVDASGRDTFLSRKLNFKEKNSRHQSAAIFGHFKNVARRPGKDEGNIGIYWFEHGWFWMIPLRDDVMSVGAVCWPEYLKTRDGDLETFLRQTIERCPPVSRRMQDAEPCAPARATGNYSYCARHMYGDGYLLVGDAFAFIDPVFSTGVYLAMNSASLGAEAVDTCLRAPESAPAALQQFEREVRCGIKIVSWFIYRFTTPVMHSLFMNPRNFFRIKEAIISMLAGDIFRATPVTLRLALFKTIYLISSAAHLPQSWAAFRKRRRNAALEFTGGTTSQDYV